MSLFVGDKPVIDLGVGAARGLYAYYNDEVVWNPDVPGGYSYGFLIQSGADGLGGSTSGPYGLMKPTPVPRLTRLTVFDAGGAVILHNETQTKYGGVDDMGVEFEGHPKFIVTWNDAKGQYEANEPTLWTFFDANPNAWVGVNYTDETAGGPSTPPHTSGLVGWWDASQPLTFVMDSTKVIQWDNVQNPLRPFISGTSGGAPEMLGNQINGIDVPTFGTVANGKNGLIIPEQDVPCVTPFMVVQMPLATVEWSNTQAAGSVVSDPATGGGRSMLFGLSGTDTWVGNGTVLFQNGVDIYGTVQSTEILPSVMRTVPAQPRFVKTLGYTGVNNEPAPAPGNGNQNGGFDIAEFLVYDYAMDQTEIDDTNAYLYAKWGITP